MRIIPLPRPTTLEYITPTGAENLGECALRAAFSASPSHQRSVLRGPASYLGTACHAVIEATIRGHFAGIPPDQLRIEFDRLWQRELGVVAARLMRSPLEQHFGLPSNWSNYALRRAELLYAVEDLLSSRPNLRSSNARSQGHEFPPANETERQFKGFNGRLRGRIDHIIHQGNHVVIEDYKTGGISEPTKDGELSLKAHYRRQLLLYAALYHEERHRWPGTAFAISLTGERIGIAVAPDEAVTLVNWVLARLEAYNQAIINAPSVESLAAPDREHCAACPYQASCSPFWQAVDETWEFRDTVYVAGTVAEVLTHQGETCTISVDVVRGNVVAGRYFLGPLRMERFLGIHALPAGTHIRVLRARLSRGAAFISLIPNDYTEIWWSDPSSSISI